MSEAGKTAAKLKNNAGWAPFLGELGLLTLLFEACNHITHCMRFRGRCQYVESETRSDVPVQRVPGAIHS
jgi:hypothetical protein